MGRDIDYEGLIHECVSSHDVFSSLHNKLNVNKD